MGIKYVCLSAESVSTLPAWVDLRLADFAIGCAFWAGLIALVIFLFVWASNSED